MAKKNASNQSGGTFEPETQTPAEIGVSKDLVEQLMGALIAGREAGKKESAEETLFEVTNVGGTAVAFPVTDLRTGRERAILLERRGNTAKITKEQVLEVKTRFPHFFEHGHLSANAVIPDGPNVIHDLQTFIDELPASDVTTRIDQITAPSVLFELYHFIENKRFTADDEKGNPLTEQDSTGKAVPMMKELVVDPKLIAIEVAVSRRLLTLTNVKVALDA